MRLRFVYRTGCSLCDAMWAEWLDYRRRSRENREGRWLPDPERLDLAEHPELEAGYGNRIPVLEADGSEICRYFFDDEAVGLCLS